MKNSEDQREVVGGRRKVEVKGPGEERGERRQEMWRGLQERGLALVILLAVVPSMMLGQGKGKAERVSKEVAAARVTGSPQYAVLCINNLTTWSAFNGVSNHAPSGDDGMYYPRGTGSVIYQDGLVWAGKAYTNAGLTVSAPRQLVRANGTMYTSSNGMRAGAVIGSSTTAVAEDPTSPNVRIYRIRRDYAEAYNELWRDAAVLNEISEIAVTSTQVSALVAQYEKDWAEWPVAKGAPFIDRNGNGVYDPPPAFSGYFTVDSLIAGGYDEPGVAGKDGRLPADQVIWTVYNDLHNSTALAFAGSEPLGLEVQKTVWGYDRYDALGNVYFVRFRIINKGGVDVDTAAGTQPGSFWIDSLYIGQWSDPDLGNAGDDLVGCNVSTSLGYAYNGAHSDAEFAGFSLPPPSVGYDMLGGPTVPSPGDSAIVNFRRRPGVRALPMTAFGVWAAGEPVFDPTGVFPYLEKTGQWWKVLRGYRPSGTLVSGDLPFNSGPYPESRFQFPDDPLLGPGQVDGLGTTWSQRPGDRRFLLASGPVRLAPGDTQEVYIAVVAGLGADRLSSIAIMRSNDRTAQSIFDRGLVVPTPPARPVVTATELDASIVLNWGSNLEAVRETEDRTVADVYAFEGYVVYQLPSAGSSLTDGTKIATFDVKNGRTKILSEVYDYTTDFPVLKVIQEGTDSGIQRSLKIMRNVEDVDQWGYVSWSPVRNGHEYHFAVTAYNVASDANAVPVSLESDPVRLTVKPRIPFGQQLSTAIGETLGVVHVSGVSDALIAPVIVDPMAGRGDTFRISFRRVGGESRWSLQKRTRGTTLLTDQPIVDDDAGYPIVDGALVASRAEAFQGLKPNAWVFNGNSRNMTWVSADGLQLEEFLGAAGWEAPVRLLGTTSDRPVAASALKKILIRLVAHDTSSAGAFDATNDNLASYAYRFVINADQPAAQPSFASWIVNAAGGGRFQDYRISMPLAVYDIDANPPQRLAVGYTENNVTAGLVDGYYWPSYFNTITSNTSSTGPREWLLVMDVPYTDATPVAAWQQIASDTTIPVMYTLTWNRRNVNPWTPPLE